MKIETAVPVRPLALAAAPMSIPAQPAATDTFTPAPANAVAAPEQKPAAPISLRGFKPSLVTPCGEADVPFNDVVFSGTLADGRETYLVLMESEGELKGTLSIGEGADNVQVDLSPQQLSDAIDGIIETPVVAIQDRGDGIVPERSDLINWMQTAFRPFAGFKPTEVFQCGDYSYDIGGTLPDGQQVWVIAVLDEQGNVKVDECRFLDDSPGERVLTRDEIADLLSAINKNEHLQVEDMVDGNTNADGRKTMIQRLQAALG